jgi:hypothetical protein
MLHRCRPSSGDQEFEQADCHRAPNLARVHKNPWFDLALGRLGQKRHGWCAARMSGWLRLP